MSPLDPLVSLWLLVPVVYRFYFGPDIRFAHSRIPGKLCRGRYGSQANRFVLLSGPGRSSIHTVRISQAFRYLTLTTHQKIQPLSPFKSMPQHLPSSIGALSWNYTIRYRPRGLLFNRRQSCRGKKLGQAAEKPSPIIEGVTHTYAFDCTGWSGLSRIANLTLVFCQKIL